MPVELENLAVIGVDGLLKCTALDKVLAVSVGLKLPFRRIPLACAGTCLSSRPSADHLHGGLAYQVEMQQESRKCLEGF